MFTLKKFKTIYKKMKLKTLSMSLLCLVGVVLTMRILQLKVIPVTSETIAKPKTFPSIEFPFMEPEVSEDLPTDVQKAPKIPHIIHQTYKDMFIPGEFEGYVLSFVNMNPKWTYYFWTDASARKFIEDKYPDFLPVWDGYRVNINRADALRYFVLYEYGGVYADLDYECLRPLDRVTKLYSAIFPPEPFEHSVFRLHLPFLINNAIMMSRAKHPFLKLMIDNLASFQAMFEQLDVAGPCFVTTNYMIYNNFSNGDAYKLERRPDGNSSPYFFQGPLDPMHEDAVYIPNTHYFMNTLSTSGVNAEKMREICVKADDESYVLVKRGCNELAKRDKRDGEKEITRTSPKFTYTEHHWAETYSAKEESKSYIHIKNIKSKYKIYPDAISIEE